MRLGWREVRIQELIKTCRGLITRHMWWLCTQHSPIGKITHAHTPLWCLCTSQDCCTKFFVVGYTQFTKGVFLISRTGRLACLRYILTESTYLLRVIKTVTALVFKTNLYLYPVFSFFFSPPPPPPPQPHTLTRWIETKTVNTTLTVFD